MFRHILILCVLIGNSLTVHAEPMFFRAGLDDVLLAALPLTALWMSKEDREGQIQFFKSVGLNTLVVSALKESVDKERPNRKCCDSFPSGHTSTAFVSASFMHHRYGLRVALPAYVMATYVGYVRIDDEKHFAEDVVAGAAIGYLSGRFLTTRYENTEIAPIVQKDFYGLQVNARF